LGENIDSAGIFRRFDALRKWMSCPFEDVKNETRFLEKARNIAEQEIIEHPETHKHMPFPDIIENQEIWNRAFRRWPNNIISSGIPEKFKTPEAWKIAVMTNPLGDFVNNCPYNEVLNDPDFIAKLKQDITKSNRLGNLHEMLREGGLAERIPPLKNFLYANFKERFLDYIDPDMLLLQRLPFGNILSEDPEVREAIIKTYVQDIGKLRMGDPDWIWNDPRIQELIERRKQRQQEKSNPQEDKAAQTNNRLWSSAFNNNFIGKIS
jgi:hypothetical protein